MATMLSCKNNLRSNKSFVCTPINISDELAAFLGKEKGTKVSRANVSYEIGQYIKGHKLADERTINPDAKLAALLKVNDTDNLTYFNIQEYLAPHFEQVNA